MSSMQEETFVHKWERSKVKMRIGKISIYVVALIASWAVFIAAVYVLALVSIIVFTGVAFGSGIINQDASTELFIGVFLSAGVMLTEAFTFILLVTMLFKRLFGRSGQYWYSRPFSPIFYRSLVSLGRWVSGHQNPNKATTQAYSDSDFPPPTK